MNEDDYEFDSSETSRLSALFGKDSETGSSSLIYNAPKQPGNFSHNARSTRSKTFHKCIKLYFNGNLRGKFIIAIVTSELNPEILIYQNKKNIIFRIPICGKILYACNTSISLILKENNKQYELEFENEKDLLDFDREYAQNGGLIEIFKESNIPYDSRQHIKRNHEHSSETESIEKESVQDTSVHRSTENDRSNILTRLEKMGLPKLLLIENDEGEKENYPISKGDTISKLNTVKNREKIIDIETQKNDGNLDSISVEANQSRENITVGPQLFITQEQTDVLTSVLVDNQRNNSELKEAISLLTLKLNEIIPSREFEDKNKVKRLESRIKILELRSENLQSELKKCHEKYSEENISKYVIEPNENKQTCENSSQTDDLEYLSEETVQFKSIIMEIMDIVKAIPLNSNEISKLKSVKDAIENVQLKSYFKFIEEKNSKEDNSDVIVLTKNIFVSELKRIMNDMYQSINKFEESAETREIIAKHIKHASVEILKNYDISLQQMNI